MSRVNRDRREGLQYEYLESQQLIRAQDNCPIQQRQQFFAFPRDWAIPAAATRWQPAKRLPSPLPMDFFTSLKQFLTNIIITFTLY